jgi:hypothetical protein
MEGERKRRRNRRERDIYIEREGISKQLASTPLLLPPPAVIWIVVGKV